MSSKKLDKFIVISKIELKKFQINLMLKLFELFLKIYSLRVTFFIFITFSIVFPIRVAKLG